MPLAASLIFLALTVVVGLGVVGSKHMQAKRIQDFRRLCKQIQLIDALNGKERAYWRTTNPEHPSEPCFRPLRLLSIGLFPRSLMQVWYSWRCIWVYFLDQDGTGTRGIVSLLILDEIMQRAAPPGTRPCEWFDMIGGMATGGLIAIMLGRLRMSIPDCIAAFCSLGEQVFVDSMSLPARVFGLCRLSEEMLRLVMEHAANTSGDETFAKMRDSPEWPDRKICRT